MPSRLNRRDWLRVAAFSTIGASLPAGRARAMEADLPPLPDGGLVNLAGNENPFGPSPEVVQAIFRSAAQSCRYPFREEQVLKEMLAKKEGVPVECIVLGNGCDEILSLAAAAFLRPGTNLVAARPTYFQITDYADKLEAKVHWVPHTATMQHDLVAMARAVGPGTKLAYVCNPDNPSGTSRPASEIEAFCREVAPRVPVFLDEVYLELGENFAAETQVDLVRAGLSVVIGRSFSKLHGLAGHRIGYAVTTPALAATLVRYQMSSVNFLGVAAATAALRDSKFPDWSRRKIREGRQRYCQLLDELGLAYTASAGNFVFHQTGIVIGDYQARMKERGFLVGWPHAPIEGYEKWCRTSIGTDEEMRQLAGAMRSVFAKPA